jgi:hypothetical protein
VTIRSELTTNAVISLIVIAILGLGVAWWLGKAFAIGPLACTGWEFDRADWLAADSNSEEDLEHRRTEARQLDRCGQELLIGQTRPEVRRLLGEPDLPNDAEDRNDQWNYYVGEVNNLLGPGDAGHLFIRFDDRSPGGRADLVQAP